MDHMNWLLFKGGIAGAVVEENSYTNIVRALTTCPATPTRTCRFPSSYSSTDGEYVKLRTLRRRAEQCSKLGCLEKIHSKKRVLKRQMTSGKEDTGVAQQHSLSLLSLVFCRYSTVFTTIYASS